MTMLMTLSWRFLVILAQRGRGAASRISSDEALTRQKHFMLPHLTEKHLLQTYY